MDEQLSKPIFTVDVDFLRSNKEVISIWLVTDLYQDQSDIQILRIC